MMSVGHVLDHMPDHVLDHVIIGLVATALHIFTDLKVQVVQDVIYFTHKLLFAWNHPSRSICKTRWLV